MRPNMSSHASSIGNQDFISIQLFVVDPNKIVVLFGIGLLQLNDEYDPIPPACNASTTSKYMAELEPYS
ncbi:hypothetical protein Ancab_029125 [Ancistrocladus abbreviatus]